jgi:hypothetical protein
MPRAEVQAESERSIAAPPEPKPVEAEPQRTEAPPDVEARSEAEGPPNAEAQPEAGGPPETEAQPEAEARPEVERPSEALPASEERVVEHVAQENLPALAAGQSAGSSRPLARPSTSVRPPLPANDARPSGFGTRAERVRAARSSGPPRIASDRPPSRRIPSAPPPSQRPRATTPPVATVRPKVPAALSEPPTLRPTAAAAPPRAPDSVAATLLQMPGVPEVPSVVSSAPPPEPESAAASEPARQVPAAPTNAAWSKLLDDQGTAGGW